MAASSTIDIFVGFETSKGSIHFRNPLKFCEKLQLRDHLKQTNEENKEEYIETALELMDHAITRHRLSRQRIEAAMTAYVPCCLPTHSFQVNSITCPLSHPDNDPTHQVFALKSGAFPNDGGHTGLGVGIKAGRAYRKGQLIDGLSAKIVKRPANDAQPHFDWCEWSWFGLPTGGGAGALRGPLAYVNHGCPETRNGRYKGLGSRPATSTWIGVEATQDIEADQEILVNYSPTMQCLCQSCVNKGM